MKQCLTENEKDNDINPIFRELTEAEIDFVAGGNPAGAALAGVAGGAFYLGVATVTGEFSWGEFGATVAVGALAGMTSGASALSFFWAPRVSYFGGMGVGAGFNQGDESGGS